MKISILTLFMSLLIQFTFAQNYQGDTKDLKIILKNTAQFSEYIIAGNFKSIGQCYTEDAKIFPRNVDIIEGQKDITDYWRPSGTSKTLSHKVTATEIKILGDEAYDYGYYEGTSTDDTKQVYSWRGKYVIIWKKIDGDWKIYLDIWNSIEDK